MAEKYYSILTNRGKELEAQSSATGKPVIIKDFVVGDGNGQPVKPDPALTALVREVYRSAISALQVSPEQTNQFIAQLVLPAGVGGFVVREVGLLTDAGELYAVANCAAIEKPVSGISVKMQFRLAVSETSDIELKVATGDGLFLRQDANLGDVKDVAESRKNIGLKGAAVLDVGTSENTVAAGDDPRIVNAVQKENNLSDVQDKTLARKNLELRAAAIRDVADNAAGALVPVGYKGNFSSDSNHGAIDFATYPFVVGESLFIDTRGCTNNPPFLTQDFYYIDVVCATGPAVGGRVNRPLIQFVSYTNSKLILAIREDDGTTTGWRYLRAVQFDNDNQTVSLPGAVKAVNGGIQLSQNAVVIRGAGNKHLWFHDQNGKEMGLVYASDDKVLHLRAGEGPTVNIGSDGVVRLPGPVIDASYYQTNPSGSSGWHGAGMFASQYANAAPFLIPLRYSTPKDASVYLPMIKGLSQTDYWGYGSAVSFGILRSGKGDFGSAAINIIGDSGQAAVYTFNANGDFNVPRQIGSGGNIVAGQGLYESGGAIRVYSSNNPPPQQDLSPYATASWTIANFLQGGIRLASAGVATNGNNDNEFAYAPNGTVVTAVMQKTNYTAVQYRSLQYNIGGNWYTAWVA